MPAAAIFPGSRLRLARAAATAIIAVSSHTALAAGLVGVDMGGIVSAGGIVTSVATRRNLSLPQIAQYLRDLHVRQRQRKCIKLIKRRPPSRRNVLAIASNITHERIELITAVGQRVRHPAEPTWNAKRHRKSPAHCGGGCSSVAVHCDELPQARPASFAGSLLDEERIVVTKAEYPSAMKRLRLGFTRRGNLLLDGCGIAPHNRREPGKANTSASAACTRSPPVPSARS